jgi:hypothetical protein
MAPKKAKKKSGGRSGGRSKSDVVLGPVITKKVRVPIDEKVYKRKESEIAQLGVVVRKIERKIKPDKDQIRIHKEKINELTKDIEEQTEEKEMQVREEFDPKHNELRTLHARTKEVLEARTMTDADRQRQEDLFDEVDPEQVEPDEVTNPSDIALEDEAAE